MANSGEEVPGHLGNSVVLTPICSMQMNSPMRGRSVVIFIHGI
jgi:hypothetical protein